MRKADTSGSDVGSLDVLLGRDTDGIVDLPPHPLSHSQDSLQRSVSVSGGGVPRWPPTFELGDPRTRLIALSALEGDPSVDHKDAPRVLVFGVPSRLSKDIVDVVRCAARERQPLAVIAEALAAAGGGSR